MRPRCETVLILALLLALVAITAAAAFTQAGQAAPAPFSSASNAPDGARAFSLWLTAAGFRVDNQPAGQFSIPPDAQATLILEPSLSYEITASEWQALADWVKQGGILLLAAYDLGNALQGNPFGIVTAPVASKAVNLAPPAPIFNAPVLTAPVPLQVGSVMTAPAAGASLPLLAVPEGPVAEQIAFGQGQVLVVADSSFLTNAGLKNPGDADLALNLLAQVPAGSLVFIDEWHHGVRTAAVVGSGLQDWLTETPGGASVLFAAGIIFLALVLSGRRFGRSLPLAADQARRGPSEYVNAMANLYRRAGHRRAAMGHYHTGLKRALGKRYRIDPGLPDPEFVTRVTAYHPALDGPALLGLLGRLSQANYSEIQMVQLAREAADWLARFEP